LGNGVSRKIDFEIYEPLDVDGMDLGILYKDSKIFFK
jgi:hypothetical protein